MYRAVTDIGEVRKYLSGAAVVAFDFETAPDEAYRDEERAALDPHRAHTAGISFSAAEGDGIYVPVTHRGGGNCGLTRLLPLLADFAADPGVVKVAADDVRVLPDFHEHDREAGVLAQGQAGFFRQGDVFL